MTATLLGQLRGISWRWVWTVVSALVAGLVLALLWPQTLGGKAAYVRVDGQSMDPTFHNSDLAVVWRQSSYRVGDVVAYRIRPGEVGAGALVIHRLVGGDGRRGYVTRGDNRTVVDDWHPYTRDIVGVVELDVPRFGAVMAAMTRPVYLGGLVGFLTFAVMVVPSRPQRRRDGDGPSTTPTGLVLREAESA